LVLQLNECLTRRQFVKTATKGLGEPSEDMVSYFVRKHGEDKIYKLIYDAAMIELNGGMLTKDGTRKRTPGGVLAALVKYYCD